MQTTADTREQCLTTVYYNKHTIEIEIKKYKHNSPLDPLSNSQRGMPKYMKFNPLLYFFTHPRQLAFFVFTL
uniref:Uncharacterized protein n=1 Tax=Lotus japonicus TaxID=34305 RepID=I3SK56_LOTJA|nr:unknown [Lotus japonicus]